MSLDLKKSKAIKIINKKLPSTPFTDANASTGKQSLYMFFCALKEEISIQVFLVCVTCMCV